jgi:hypothetical protein
VIVFTTPNVQRQTDVPSDKACRALTEQLLKAVGRRDRESSNLDKVILNLFSMEIGVITQIGLL